MIHNIGIYGGHSVYELGPSSDMAAFFDCLDAYVVKQRPETDYSLLTDRLYRRYLRFDELNTAVTLIGQIKEIFARTPSASVTWKSTSKDDAHTKLDVTRTTLAEVFADYFEKIIQAKESAESFYNSFNIYQPVRILVSDMPEFITDKKRSLDQYDTLEGKPFWLR